MSGFGPQMIGATEKTLNALLHHVLADSGLTEPQWVTLRLASQNSSAAALDEIVSQRAHFADADQLVTGLSARGLIDANKLTPQGLELLTQLQGRIAGLTAHVWAGLDPDDVAATERVLTTVTSSVGKILESLR